MRSVFVHTATVVARRSLLVAMPLTAAAAVACAIGARVLAPRLPAGADPGAALAPWLHLPAFVASATTAAIAIETWPAFSRARPGAAWLERLHPGALRGVFAALVGALVALLLQLLLLGALLPAAVGAPASPRAFVRLAATTAPMLDATRSSVQFGVPAGTEGDTLWLRPLAVPGSRSPEPTRIRVLADGEVLHEADIAILGQRQLVQVPFATRAVRRFEVQRLGGDLLLWFPPDSVELQATEPRSPLANSIIALLVHLVPALVALALAAATATAASLQVNLLLCGGTLLLQALGELGPAAPTIAALLRGRWLLAEPLAAACLPSLGVAAGALLLAAAVRRAGRGRSRAER